MSSKQKSYVKGKNPSNHQQKYIHSPWQMSLYVWNARKELEKIWKVEIKIVDFLAVAESHKAIFGPSPGSKGENSESSGLILHRWGP